MIPTSSSFFLDLCLGFGFFNRSVACLQQIPDLRVYFVGGVASEADKDVPLLVVIQQWFRELVVFLQANLVSFLQGRK
jgi:hypothetical protein